VRLPGLRPTTTLIGAMTTLKVVRTTWNRVQTLLRVGWHSKGTRRLSVAWRSQNPRKRWHHPRATAPLPLANGRNKKTLGAQAVCAACPCAALDAPWVTCYDFIRCLKSR